MTIAGKLRIFQNVYSHYKARIAIFMEQVTNTEIERFLGTYMPQYRLIKDVSYSSGMIQAEIIPFIYPFTLEDSGHVNATQINLYLSQLAYILMAKSIADPSYAALTKYINPGEFNKKMHDRNLFFAAINTKLKRVMHKKNFKLQATMQIESIRKISGKIFCDVSFNLGKGSCTGNVIVCI